MAIPAGRSARFRKSPTRCARQCGWPPPGAGVVAARDPAGSPDVGPIIVAGNGDRLPLRQRLPAGDSTGTARAGF
ncbi:MAG TPA: hypothetical protein PK440_07180 [Candidatus Accumulibacter phosphatis]|nr:hypothetical protein [Accumulibacter sp.]HCV12569.1 hypothetical protein [Accumulibacter sp.]HRL75434.1 hypothetical protein [Candidatus Accumulibacter phosphatis]HRQ93992.1 hypothetical protein [Candidatus Accumulibacter phosphatis]HRQ94766.1 hypothetical protein [Candidatus Accumulibacter phosphatis]